MSFVAADWFEQYACTGNQTGLQRLAVLWAFEATQMLTIMAFAPEVHDSRTAQAQDASSWIVYRAVLMSLHCTCYQLH